MDNNDDRLWSEGEYGSVAVLCEFNVNFTKQHNYTSI